MPDDWMNDRQGRMRGPEYLRGISRLPDYPDDQDFSGAFIDPDLEAVGRLVRACSMLETSLFQAVSRLNPYVTFEEAEWDFGIRGCTRWLKSTAQDLTSPARIALEGLLDKAGEHFALRNAVVHGRNGRMATSDIYESHRWVKEKGQPPKREKVEYDRNRLLLASVRAGNVAADVLDGLDAWSRQLSRIRRLRREQLGPGHPMRIEELQEEGRLLHALAVSDATTALCGADTSAMDGFMVPDSAGVPHHELMFEDSNPRSHCKKCRVASGL